MRLIDADKLTTCIKAIGYFDEKNPQFNDWLNPLAVIEEIESQPTVCDNIDEIINDIYEKPQAIVVSKELPNTHQVAYQMLLTPIIERLKRGVQNDV